MASGPGDTVKDVSLSDIQSGLGILAGASRETWAWLEASRQGVLVLHSGKLLYLVLRPDEPDGVHRSRDGWGWPVSGDMHLHKDIHGDSWTPERQPPPPPPTSPINSLRH